jgi:alpha-galactosidase
LTPGRNISKQTEEKYHNGISRKSTIRNPPPEHCQNKLDKSTRLSKYQLNLKYRGRVMKIVFIGAGSFRFTYQLLRNFAALSRIIPFEIWLVDIDARMLKAVTGILMRMVQKQRLGHNLKVLSTTDRREALKDAEAVVISISIGQQASEFYDIRIANAFGIPHTTGDTCGPGGIMRAMRTIPVVNSILSDINRLSPEALVLNYTNPMSAITLAANQAFPEVKTLGICHELLHGMPVLSSFLNKVSGKDIPNWESMDIRYAGINHFAWILALGCQGQDLYPLLREHAGIGRSQGPRRASFMLMEQTGYFPYPGPRHVLEFMPEYFNHFNEEAMWRVFNHPLARHIGLLIQFEGIPRLRDVGLLALQRRMVTWVFEQTARGRIPAPSPSFEGERVVEMIADRLTAKAGLAGSSLTRRHPVNVLNHGCRVVGNLPENCAVETAGFFADDRIETDTNINLPENILKLVLPFALNQQRIVDAAQRGSREALLDALANDPVCRFIEDGEAVENLMLNMLHHERSWLPQFEGSFPTEQELRRSGQYATKEDLRRGKVLYPPREQLRKKSYFP